MTNSIINHHYIEFLENLKKRVESNRQKAILAVNQELIFLYHYIGQEILKQEKLLASGRTIIQKLSKDLTKAFPEMKGFGTANLYNMRRFAELYKEWKSVQQVVGNLPWGHQIVLMEKIKDQKARIFYMEKTIEYGWSRSVLRHHIELELYEREGKGITNFKTHLPSPQSELAQQSLKDPYIFDFLSLSKEAKEREIESSLVHHMEKFLMELGSGFCFVGRQYHIQISNKDFYIDLLMYHLKLRAFVVIEIKADEFQAEHIGKMNLYLSAVDDLVKHPQDNPSIGLILCKTKDDILAEYTLRSSTKAIGLAEYITTQSLPKELKTNLPTIEELEAELKTVPELKINN